MTSRAWHIWWSWTSAGDSEGRAIKDDSYDKYSESETSPIEEILSNLPNSLAHPRSISTNRWRVDLCIKWGVGYSLSCSKTRQWVEHLEQRWACSKTRERMAYYRQVARWRSACQKTRTWMRTTTHRLLTAKVMRKKRRVHNYYSNG